MLPLADKTNIPQLGEHVSYVGFESNNLIMKVLFLDLVTPKY